MPYFKDSREMYEIHRALLECLASHPEVGPELARAKLVISFKVHDPEGIITINCKSAGEGKYFSYLFGESNLKPDLLFTNSADFLHKFWQGKANIVASILAQQTKIEGNMTQAMKLLPMIKPISSLYPQILKEIGRQDLIIP